MDEGDAAGSADPARSGFDKRQHLLAGMDAAGGFDAHLLAHRFPHDLDRFDRRAAFGETGRSVRAIASHGVMSGPASERVEASAIEEMVFTDSIPFSGKCSKVKQLSIAPLLAQTIQCVENNESISKQYLC